MNKLILFTLLLLIGCGTTPTVNTKPPVTIPDGVHSTWQGSVLSTSLVVNGNITTTSVVMQNGGNDIYFILCGDIRSKFSSWVGTNTVVNLTVIYGIPCQNFIDAWAN